MGLFDIFKKKDIEEDIVNSKDGDCEGNKIFEKFINTFKPDDNLIKPTEEELQQFENILPSELLNFWKQYGFGNYGNGILKIINPLDYMESLYEWLGKEDYSKIPVILTAFGDIIYYRKLSEDVEDMCLLSIHYRNCIVCSYSLKEFFESYIVDEEIYSEVLRTKLFEQS